MAIGGKREGAGRKPNRVKAEAAKDTPPVHPSPQGYDPLIVEQARKLCELGATDVELADFFGINTATIYRWKSVYPEFCEATRVGKSSCDDRVERSLYQRAVGYTFESVKIFMPAKASEPVYAPYREHVPPDTAAASLWLRNRRKEDWRDKHEYEHSGTLNTRDVSELSDAELMEVIRAGRGGARGSEPPPSPDGDNSVH